MKISRMAGAVEPSLARKLFNMTKQYTDVVDLTLGDPDLKPNQRIREAACEAVMAGKSRYSQNAGLADLRAAAGALFEKEYGQTVDPATEMIVTVGGMEALFLSLACLIDDGDEVIIPAPYYVNYVQMVRMLGGVPVILYSTEAEGFHLDPAKVEAAVTDRTVAVIVNSPCNPTGEVLPKDVLERLAKIAVEKDLVVISDEVYKTLVYDGATHESIIREPGMRERTVLIDSLSKRFSMTGYRVGYAIAPAELVANMVKMQENVAACAPVPSQHAGICAYSECADDPAMLETFTARRDFMYEAINAIPKLSCRKPAGTFYLFVNIEETGLECLDFCYKLLEAVHVAVVPGITYGKEYGHYVRIAFTHDVEVLREGAERIRRFAETL